MKTFALLILGLSTISLSSQAAHADDFKYNEHIASQIHQINQMEMQMGQLARTKGTSVDVREFGARIYNDHQAADERLMKIAADMKLKISNPVARNATERKQQSDTAALMKKLDSVSGAEFDKAFLKGMYSGHREVISMMSTELKSIGLGPSELKDFVSNTLMPNLHQHADIAMSIENRYYA